MQELKKDEIGKVKDEKGKVKDEKIKNYKIMINKEEASISTSTQRKNTLKNKGRNSVQKSTKCKNKNSRF